ncbi:hypothetical protein Patl1_16636 [Pistacia atlantica]|uniref:Uncharacterized protein n=1 Tax=Pistacia atlantica TaxID=434234 RepID=A0ACC1B6Y6_9ROSI|nr:hypothetical protein Patl1_16636 [Pistacia atlantica]
MKMVTLIVATTIDPASINPATALLSMPGWHPWSFLPDNRWEEATGEVVNDVIFLSKHTAVSNRPALTVHPIGVPHLREGEVTPQGGRPGWAAPPNPRIGPWLRLLKKIAQSHNLVPEFEITLEGTHHGPVTNKPTMFVEIVRKHRAAEFAFGSTEEYWRRQDAAQVIALLIWEGLGLGEGAAYRKLEQGEWQEQGSSWDRWRTLCTSAYGHSSEAVVGQVLIHLCFLFKVTASCTGELGKDDVWVGHLLSGYSLPMEDPNQSKADTVAKDIGGTWKQAIKAAFDTMKSAFPGGEILAHLDHKSFKGWQKNAIIGFLSEQNIKVGKPNDFN